MGGLNLNIALLAALALLLVSAGIQDARTREIANWKNAVSLNKDQFRFGFGNALTRQESDELFERWRRLGL